MNYKVKGIVVDDNNISSYGIDIESELTKVLSEELAKGIDREILKSLGILERPIRRKNSINRIYKNVC
jgi:hypothetical protein